MGNSAARELRKLLDRSGLSQDEFAKLAGYKGASSVQRYLNPEQYEKPHFPIETTKKFAKALVGRGSPPIKMEEVLVLSDVNGLPHGVLPAPEIEGHLHVQGKVEAGAWRELDEEHGLAEEVIPLGADPRYRGFPQYALEVVGTSMNRLFREGEYLICVDAIEYGKPPVEGDLVIVHRHRGGMLEATVKRVRQGLGRLDLWPESTDPKHQEPLRLGEFEDELVEVVAFVIGRYERF